MTDEETQRAEKTQEELSKISYQANIVRGFKKANNARYVFLNFGSGQDLRDFLGRAKCCILAENGRDDKKIIDFESDKWAALNVALTRAGLDLADKPEAYKPEERLREVLLKDLYEELEWMIEEDADAFVRPMRDRLELMGETDSSWHPEWKGEAPIHVLAWFSGASPEAIEKAVKDVGIPPGKIVISIDGTADIGQGRGVGYFGFKDGLSQPAIEGVHSDDDFAGRGVQYEDGKWRGVRAGEFITGLPDESEAHKKNYDRVTGEPSDEGFETRNPGPSDILKHCTYLVFRQIEMHVGDLAVYLEEHHEVAKGPDGDSPSELEHTLASWLVGRKRHEQSAEGEHLLPATGAKSNIISYAADPEGEGCPLGAHVRRAHPRDGTGFGGKRTNRHRIIRRGMPYARTDENGNPEQGLAFIALQARIEDQFEFIQRHWLNEGSTLHLGVDPDPIAGNRLPDVSKPRFIVQGDPMSVVPLPLDGFTTVRGGEYFVMPTLDGLEKLANG